MPEPVKDYILKAPHQDTELSESGTGFNRVWEVPYKIISGPATGTEGYVRIPAAQYSPDIVGAAVEHAVKVHQEVMNLPHDPRSYV